MSIPYSECAASMKGWTGGKKKKETQGYPGEQDDAQFKERGSGLGAKKKKKTRQRSFDMHAAAVWKPVR